MSKEHFYELTLDWTGNQGPGTRSHHEYSRNHTIQIDEKPIIEASSDPSFRGDSSKHNPEELLLASISSCHMLWYLSCCAKEGVVVTRYQDRAKAVMVEEAYGGGYFKEAVLHPVVTVEEEFMREKAMSLHRQANELCFIANSLNFPVKHIPVVEIEKV